MKQQHVSGSEMNSPILDIQVEHWPGDVLGLGEASPRLSWTYGRSLPSDATILVRVERMKPESVEPRVQTATLPVEPHILVEWPFAPLGTRERVSVTMTVLDAVGMPIGPACDPRVAETGLLQPFNHVAAFVGPSWPEFESDHRRLPLVRTEFVLPEKPRWARLYLSAQGLVEAYVNGVKVGDDALTPGWTCYDERLECWTYDVSDLADEGTNAMGFWLGDGWFRGRIGFDGGRVNYYGDRISVFAQLEACCSDGKRRRFCSNAWDGAWKVTPGPIMSSDLCEGETYDARLAPVGWTKPGFDDSDWKPVAEVFYDPAKLVCPQSAGVRRQERRDPVLIMRTGETRWMVDFGQNCTQRVALHMRGLTEGQRIDMRHAEVLDANGAIVTSNLRRGQQHDVFVSDGHDQWWEPRFAMHGFRYLEIDGWPGKLDAEDIECRVYGSDMERVGWFSCSDSRLNRLFDNAVWSMRSNFVSIPMDCPQRDERLGWTGDIGVFAPTANLLYDVQGFLSSWLDDLRHEQIRWGSIPFYVPYVPLGPWTPPTPVAVWGDAAATVPWSLYWSGGDVAMLARHYPLMRDWVDQVSGLLSDDGVWSRRPSYPLGQLGDWLDPSAPPSDPMRAMTPKDLVATAYYVRSCSIAAETARVLGFSEDAERFGALRDRVATGFIGRYVLDDGTMTADTQCAYSLAISFGLLDHDSVLRSCAGDRLAALVADAGYTIGTGFAGTPHVLASLASTGHTDTAYRLLMSERCPGWLYQVSMGATTTWERWDSMRSDGTLNPSGMTSFNHYAFGCVAEWMVATIAGLIPVEPGWRRIRIAPRPGGGLSEAEASHLTPFGMVSVHWLIEGDLMRVSILVPEGATATLDTGLSPLEVLGPGSHERTVHVILETIG